MSRKPEEVIKFYVACNKLKDVIRTGWKDVWHVRKERLESVAEHVYGVQMLAIAMCLEYGYEIDLMKVIMMLADAEVKEIAEGKGSAAEIWMEYNRQKNGYDENFLAVSRYAEEHDIAGAAEVRS